MNRSARATSDTGDRSCRLVEAEARVVAVEGSVAWLQPLQQGGCGACASASVCGAATLGRAAGTGRAGPLAARCLPVAAERLEVGDRVVVGMHDDALAGAALMAYALPLAAMLAAAMLAEMAGAGDGVIGLAMAAGLAAGFALSRRVGARMAEAPRVLRPADVLAPSPAAAERPA